ncbi:MAG TPA: T9SS type A sorting domain-containing protein [Rhodothermales bacterium]|nr:T9SS type A sorting domain-containing protein [Rhodothermales bacterium]
MCSIVCLLWPELATAQIPTGGLELWLRADADVTTDESGYVSQWVDQSSNGFLATQSAAANRPLLVMSGLNSLPVLRFDHTDDYMTLGDILDPVFAGAGKQFSLFAVVLLAPVMSDAGYSILGKYGACGENHRQFKMGMRDQVMNMTTVTPNGASFYNVRGTTSLAHIPSMVTYQYDGTQSGGGGLDRFMFQINGAPETVTLFATGGALFNLQDVTAQLGIGGWVGTDGTSCGDRFSEDIAEILLYNTLLDQNDRLQVEDYLATKYGITLLPVELTAFNTVLDGRTALLTWTTASETNNAGFVVMQQAEGRGQNPRSWQKVGWVDGHGTTEVEQTYHFQIDDLSPGSHRFRLKQIDYDGTFAYSPEMEVAIDLPAAFLLTAPYPNPSTDHLYFSLMVKRTQHVQVVLFNMLGRQVATIYRGMLAAETARSFSVVSASLPPGLYVLRVEGEHFIATHPVTIVR